MSMDRYDMIFRLGYRICSCSALAKSLSWFNMLLYFSALLCLFHLISCEAFLAFPPLGSHIPSIWQLHSIPAADTILSFNLALKQRNIDKLEALVQERSDPNADKYLQWLDLDSLTQLIQPQAAQTAELIKFLQLAGAVQVDTVLTRDFLTVRMPLSAAEQLFQTRFLQFSHQTSKRRMIRAATAAVIPTEINSHIDLITGLFDFFDYSSERKGAMKGQKKEMYLSDECGSNAPEIGRPKGSERDIAVSINVYCYNGQKSTNAQNPCADHNLPLSSVTVTYNFQGTVYAPVIFIGKVGTEQLKCYSQGGFVSCQMLPQAVPPFARATITAISTFANGATSSESTYHAQFSPSPYLTPAKYYEIYNVPQGYRATNSKNLQAVTAFEEQYVNISYDLTNFYKYVGLPYESPIIVGQNDESNPGGEATLDLQYISAIGAGVKTKFWSVTGNGPAEGPGNGAYILEWALQVANTSQSQVPLVTSISYGDTEMDYYNKFNGSFIYIYRTEIELLKMAARGLTVLAGSGDAGASNAGEMGNDLGTVNPDCSIARAFYPSNSKYVTSVSSTFLTTHYLPVCEQKLGNNQPIECTQVGERAVGVDSGMAWSTGGGFSNLTTNPTAKWQATLVKQYLATAAAQNLLPPSYWFNAAGRAYPDISTVGHNLICVLGGEITTIDGTSASGPVMAGLVSLLNDVLLNAGFGSIGLMNPFLYQAKLAAPDSIRDVVTGTNKDADIQPRCSSYPERCAYGFTTAPYWNPVTGLGTPNWTELKDYLLSLLQKKQPTHKSNHPTILSA
jgi:hypothetical protein